MELTTKSLERFSGGRVEITDSNVIIWRGVTEVISVGEFSAPSSTKLVPGVQLEYSSMDYLRLVVDGSRQWRPCRGMPVHILLESLYSFELIGEEFLILPLSKTNGYSFKLYAPDR